MQWLVSPYCVTVLPLPTVMLVNELNVRCFNSRGHPTWLEILFGSFKEEISLLITPNWRQASDEIFRVCYCILLRILLIYRLLVESPLNELLLQNPS